MQRASVITGVLRLLALLPLPLVHALGSGLGLLLYWLPNGPRRIACTNLRLCFPELDRRQHRHLLRRNLQQTGKTFLELGPLWLWPGERILALVRATAGEQLWRDQVAKGKGAIILTPHLGAWEIAGLYVSSRDPITILYRPSRLGIDALIRAGRQKLGARAVPTDRGGVRELLRSLHKGGVLGILPDQDPGPDNGVFAPFFGHSANTMTLVSRLAIKSGVPVFLVYAERLPRARGYRLHYFPLPPEIKQMPLEHSLIILNHAVEQAVRQRPEQYLWAYKRFKTLPPSTPRRYH